MNYLETIIAGFGGQGILSAGRILATTGLVDNKNVSWYPSYGPEMRGGTANCGIIVSDSLVGSPIVNNPDVAIVMNISSLEKFEDTVKPNGMIIADSSLVPRMPNRDDVRSFYIPATKISHGLGNKTFANIVLLGKLIKETGITTPESFENALRLSLPARKHHMIPDEMKALKIGMEYEVPSVEKVLK